MGGGRFPFSQIYVRVAHQPKKTGGPSSEGKRAEDDYIKKNGLKKRLGNFNDFEKGWEISKILLTKWPQKRRCQMYLKNFFLRMSVYRYGL